MKGNVSTPLAVAVATLVAVGVIAMGVRLINREPQPVGISGSAPPPPAVHAATTGRHISPAGRLPAEVSTQNRSAASLTQ